LQSKFLGKAPAHFYDVGCGKGYLSFELAERVKDGLRLTLVDGGAGTVEACRLEVKKRGI
jgi:16S rRNA G1207 methylase RsmC